MTFRNRTEAGERLAEKLQSYKDKPSTLVLSLVRGGVVVGKSLADALNLPLFPYIVRKIGHPGNPEYAMGAIAEGGAQFLENTAGVSDTEIEALIEEEMAELRRRKEAYTVRPRPPLKGKTIILTDDGAATGATMLVAIEDLRQAGVAKIVVAIPVCPTDTARKLKRVADEAVILSIPFMFGAVGQFYEDFRQVEDDEVIRLLSGSPRHEVA